jgi:hypothetical protein
METRKIDETTMRRLQKLLALAGSDNEHEAALAMGKAQEIMKEHNLSTIDVSMDGRGAHVADVEMDGMTKTAQKWEYALGHAIAKAFDGRAIQRSGSRHKGWSIIFVAGRTDMEIITDLFTRLRETIRRMSQEYVARELPYSCLGAKSLHTSYRHGVVDTVRERLQKMVANSRPDMNTANACGVTGRELMIVKDKAVAQRTAKLFPSLRTIAMRSGISASGAYGQGRADGQNVGLHRSVNGGGSGPIGIGR